MKYEPIFHPGVEGQLGKLGKTIYERVLKKIGWLTEHVDTMRHEPLTGQWAGRYKLRVGDYRVIYNVDRKEHTVSIYVIRHRREVYKEH